LIWAVYRYPQFPIFSFFFFIFVRFIFTGVFFKNICLGHKHNPNLKALTVQHYVYKQTYLKQVAGLLQLSLPSRFRRPFSVHPFQQRPTTQWAVWRNKTSAKKKIKTIKKMKRRGLFTSLIDVYYCSDQKNSVMFISRIILWILVYCCFEKKHREWWWHRLAAQQ